KSFFRLQDVDTGFDAKNILTVNIAPPPGKYPRAQRAEFFRQVVEKVESLPGVTSAGLTWQIPMSGAAGGIGFQIEGRTPDPNNQTTADIRHINPGYLSTMGIPVLRGRGFAESDMPLKAAIISETMARRFWPDEDALGKRIKVFGQSLEIVGIVKDTRHTALDAQPSAELYLPLINLSMHLVVRTESNPLKFVAAVREQIQSIDPDQPISDVATMEQLTAASVSARRFNMLLLGLFAAVALALTMAGIYGVISYGVAQRTREIGIRVALGASRSDVSNMVVRQGMSLTFVGVAIGLAASLALTRLMKSLLFGVSATDPLTFAAIALLLILVALAACYIPALRAAKVDPMVALRYE
ncbi:MAG TPA: FtsX-like permease family protein, partial [Blastocatellia bacterium]